VKFKSTGIWKYYQVLQELQAANARFTALKSHIHVLWIILHFHDFCL